MVVGNDDRAVDPQILYAILAIASVTPHDPRTGAITGSSISEMEPGFDESKNTGAYARQADIAPFLSPGLSL